MRSDLLIVGRPASLRTADLVDKWGGEVYRVFQAWYMDGKRPEDVQAMPTAEAQVVVPANTAPDEMETMSVEAAAHERRRRTGEAMLLRRILEPKTGRRRDKDGSRSHMADDTD